MVGALGDGPGSKYWFLFILYFSIKKDFPNIPESKWILAEWMFGDDNMGCVQIYPDVLGLPIFVISQTRHLSRNQSLPGINGSVSPCFMKTNTVDHSEQLRVSTGRERFCWLCGVGTLRDLVSSL